MPGSDTKITCPNCGHEFELSEAIVSQLKEELEKKILQAEKSDDKEKIKQYIRSLQDLIIKGK